MQKPRIGITTSFVDGEQRLTYAYVKAIEKAGGLPIIIPMLSTQAAINEFAMLLDGLLITGGPAITQGLIGTLPTDISETDPIRTFADEQFLEQFVSNRKPILGICYGMQLLNASSGGTIYADVTSQVENTQNHSKTRGAIEHEINIERNSLLFEVLGKDTLIVNTRHIQALATVGDEFSITAYAPDGVIEAIEHKTKPIWGVQFHPEQMEEDMAPLFEHFVAIAQKTTL